MSKLRYRFICIDMDGTIAHDTYPEIGDPKPHAIRVMERIKEHGGQIAIWSCRPSSVLKPYLDKWMIPYDTINQPFPEVLERWSNDLYIRKVYGDVYIDDRCIFAKEKGIDWLEVETLLFEEDSSCNKGFSIQCNNCGSHDCEVQEEWDYNYYDELEYGGTYILCNNCGNDNRF